MLFRSISRRMSDHSNDNIETALPTVTDNILGNDPVEKDATPVSEKSVISGDVGEKRKHEELDERPQKIQRFCAAPCNSEKWELPPELTDYINTSINKYIPSKYIAENVMESNAIPEGLQIHKTLDLT